MKAKNIWFTVVLSPSMWKGFELKMILLYIVATSIPERVKSCISLLLGDVLKNPSIYAFSNAPSHYNNDLHCTLNLQLS
jgi:hypothetical protein